MTYKQDDLLSTARDLQEFVKGFATKLGDEWCCEREQLLTDVRENKLVCIVTQSEIPEQFVPFKKQLIVTPGNGSLSTVDAICYQLLTQPEQLYVLPSSRDAMGVEFLRVVKESGWPVDYFTPQTEDTLSRFGEHLRKYDLIEEFDPDLAILYGSDETIRELESHLSSGTRVVRYGSKTSIGIHFLREANSLYEYTELYASDFFKYSGVGCLNTSVLYLITDELNYELYKDWLASFVESRSSYLKDPSWSSSACLQASMIRADVNFYQDQGVFLREVTDDPSAVGIGRGTAVIVLTDEFESIQWEWRRRGRYLSSATVCYGDIDLGSRTAEMYCTESLFEMGISRLTIPGQAQSPTYKWKHDGLPLVPVWGREVGWDL